MLTPAFDLSQDSRTVIINIKAPFAKVSDTEVYIDGCEFKFYSKPYYLRLNLPGEIVEDGSESAKYDTDQGHFVIQVSKANVGEHFEGLDMLTKLLAPVGQTSAKAPLIEVLDSAQVAAGEAAAEDDEEQQEEIDWQLEQQPFQEAKAALLQPKYGFANQRSGVFTRLQSELHNVIDLRDADSVPAADRRRQRIEDEDAHFDDDHYLADLYNEEGIEPLLAYRPPWVEEYNQVKDGANPQDIVEIPEELKEKMRKLPRKEYVLDKEMERQTMLGLVDLIWAYAYNYRTTEGENTTPTSIHDAVMTSLRRSLCYPLYRNWKLARRILKDTQRIFAIGRRCLLRCLLELHNLLIDTDNHYILNDLYITDYCVWVQAVSEKCIRSLAKSLSQIKIEKKCVGFDLVALERAAELALQESREAEDSRCSNPEQLSADLNRLSLQNNSQEPAVNNSGEGHLAADVTLAQHHTTSCSPVINRPESESNREESDSSDDSESESESSESCSSDSESDEHPSDGPKQSSSEGTYVISENTQKTKPLIEELT